MPAQGDLRKRVPVGAASASRIVLWRRNAALDGWEGELNIEASCGWYRRVVLFWALLRESERGRVLRGGWRSVGIEMEGGLRRRAARPDSCSRRKTVSA
ncbi:MAG: hypothetical protein IPM58_04650 [Nitrospira sp.]|nr:hypothetical protein [Nitrospira sp.]